MHADVALSRALKDLRLVKNSAIKAKHRFRGRVASGRKEVVYNNDLPVHTLTHFLYLVIFLDCAKGENLLHPCPSLFRKTFKVKSSVGMLEAFVQFLHGEGDFVGTLQRKTGFVVSHKQGLIEEFDFTVSNLTVDLRDGVRLMRLVEVLTGEWGLASVLRMPAVSRLQKVFNTGKALKRLECEDALGVCTAVAPSVAWNIVDGNREATLRLLWSIIARFSLPVLLDREALVSEAEAVISATGKWRRAGLTVAYPELPTLKMPDVAALRESWSDSSGGGTSDQRRERVLRASQQLDDVFCRRPRAVPLGVLLPSLDASPQRYPEDNGTPSPDLW
ncbi:unnamed protein product [Ascophyllum nodosum]